MGKGFDIDEIDDIFGTSTTKKKGVIEDDDYKPRAETISIKKKLTPREIKRQKYLDSLNKDLEITNKTSGSRELATLPKSIKEWVASEAPDFEVNGKRFDEDIPREDVEDEGNDLNDANDNANKNDNLIAKPSKLKGNVSEKRVRSLMTMFGQRADAVIQMLDYNEHTDGALSLVQRSLLQTMIDLLPIVERQVRRTKGKKGIYQLNQTVAQVREMIQDMQAMREKGNLGLTIVERVIRPAYLDLAAQVQQAYMEIEAQAKGSMSEADFAVFKENALYATKKGLADYLNGQYSAIKDGVITSLS